MYIIGLSGQLEPGLSLISFSIEYSLSLIADIQFSEAPSRLITLIVSERRW